MDNAASFVGSIPEHYDQGLGPVIFVDYAADIASRAAALAPRRVLETAAGTGIVTRALRDRLPATASLVATDLNAPMLEIARSKLRDGEAVAFQPADAQALPFADQSFDLVVCQFGIMFYPDKPLSLREAFRVLEPGGTYLFSVWDGHEHNPFAAISYRVPAASVPDDPPQFYKVPFSCGAIDPIKAMLKEAGFAGVEIAVVPIEKEIPSAEQFARGIVYGNPLIDQLRGRGVDPEQVVAELVGEFHRTFGADPGRMPLQAIVYAARRPGPSS